MIHSTRARSPRSSWLILFAVTNAFAACAESPRDAEARARAAELEGISQLLGGPAASVDEVLALSALVDSARPRIRGAALADTQVTAAELRVRTQLTAWEAQTLATLRSAVWSLRDSIPGLPEYVETYGAWRVPTSRQFSHTVLTPTLETRFARMIAMGDAANHLTPRDTALERLAGVARRFEEQLVAFERWTAETRDAHPDEALVRFRNEMHACDSASARRDGTGGTCAVTPSASILRRYESQRKRVFKFEPFAEPR